MIAIEPAQCAEASLAMVCILRAGKSRFGIKADRICEVLGEIPSQTVPLAPSYIDRVIPYRGEILTAVKLRTLLGLNEHTPAPSVLVLNDHESDERYALIVDAIEGLTTIDRDTMEPNPGSLDAQSMFLFDGLYRAPSGLIVRLNTQHLKPSRIAESGLFDHTAAERNGWTR